MSDVAVNAVKKEKEESYSYMRDVMERFAHHKHVHTWAHHTALHISAVHHEPGPVFDGFAVRLCSSQR